VLGYLESLALETKQKYHSDWVHVSTVRNGKITRWRGFANTAAPAHRMVKSTHRNHDGNALRPITLGSMPPDIFWVWRGKHIRRVVNREETEPLPFLALGERRSPALMQWV
jgi:hypothetical protein